MPDASRSGEPESPPHAGPFRALDSAIFVNRPKSPGHGRDRVATRSGHSGCASTHAQSAALCHTVLSQLPTPIRDAASNTHSVSRPTSPWRTAIPETRIWILWRYGKLDASRALRMPKLRGALD
ncbi:hypothetical protein CN245_18180 [Sinorhizobium meliloti]|nr:hypothetical protein CN245_18180 [Sinorhizobium meliloti]